MTIELCALAASLLASGLCGFYVKRRIDALERRVSSPVVLAPRNVSDVRSALPHFPLPEVKAGPPIGDLIKAALVSQTEYESEHAYRQAHRMASLGGLKGILGAGSAHGAYSRDQRVQSVLLRVRSACVAAGVTEPADLPDLVNAAVAR